MIGREIAPSDLVFFDPELCCLSVRQSYFYKPVANAKPGAYLESVVAVQEYAIPDDQGIPATFGDKISFELAALASGKRRNERLKFRIDSECCIVASARGELRHQPFIDRTSSKIYPGPITNDIAGSDHIRHGPDFTSKQHHSHRHHSGVDHRLQIPAFQFVTPLNFENGIAVEKVCFHNLTNLGRQIVDEGGCEIGGGGDQAYGRGVKNVPFA